jgi:broad specificity phosphatase PhoE
MTRFVEIRRHSYTEKGEERGHGSHISADGVRLARRVGETMGPYATVVASDVPRTTETAIAMGFSVDDVLPFPEGVEWEAVIDEIGWHALWEIEEPFAYVARSLPVWPNAATMARYFVDRWLSIAASIGDRESALVVSHGQLMEVALVCCMPDADHRTWGRPFGHCEGVRLSVREDELDGVEFFRCES